MHMSDIEQAYFWYNLGIKPSWSSDLGGYLTAGYGKIYYGEFEFPLHVDQETLKIIPIRSN